MDATAISLCMDHALPIIVFELLVEGNIRRVVTGEPIGTLVSATGGVQSMEAVSQEVNP